MVDKQMDKTSRQRDDDDDLKEKEDRLRSSQVRDGFGKETSGIVPQKEFPEKLADEQGAILKSDVGSYRREADDTETSLRSAQRSRKADEDSRIRCRTASICSAGNHLPSEILEEILLRVPVSSLFRFKMASRAWTSLFSGSSFINKHLKRGEKWFVHVRPSEVWVVENADKTCPRYRKIRDFDREVIRSLVQCDGLILCSTMSQGSKGQVVRKLVVWDLNETRWLDKDNLSLYDFYLFGHDSNQLYKIVKFNSGAFDRDTDVYEPSMEIYDFYSNGWRSVDLTLPDSWEIPRPMMVVSLEGNSYWLAYSEGHRVVQSFDFSAEAFTAISLPPTVKGGILSLSSQGDQLFLLSQQCEQCSVWLKGREQVAQWEKLFQVTRGADQPDCGQSLLIKDKTIISFSEEVVENGTGSQVRISRIGQDEIGQFQTAIFRRYTRPSINSVYAPRPPTLFHSLIRLCLKKVKSEPSPRIFSLKELQLVTNSFNNDNKIGEGRFGSVYWGQLSDASQIAVKRLKAWSSREEIDFAVEVEILARIRHKNLLSVRGYCEEGQERLIVYDYMPNLSLVSRLHGQSLLDWTRRMNIAVTTAQLLAPKIVHGDVRASNVLLDSEFEARVADFGYGKLMPDDAEDGAAKTTKGNNLGYLSPECVESGKESDMGDVYSFGIVLLELVTGKRPIERVNQTTELGITKRVLSLVYDRKFGEIVDQRLNGKYVEEELKRVVLVGLLCVQIEPGKRPTMSQVVEMLTSESKENMALH